MTFKIKPLDATRPEMEAETALDAVAAVGKLQERHDGAVSVEVDDRRLSADEKTASERDLLRRQQAAD